MLRVGSVLSSPYNSIVLETKAHIGSNLGLANVSHTIVIAPTIILMVKYFNFSKKCHLNFFQKIITNNFVINIGLKYF